jgi:hypothetical protein
MAVSPSLRRPRGQMTPETTVAVPRAVVLHRPSALEAAVSALVAPASHRAGSVARQACRCPSQTRCDVLDT